MIDNNKFVYKYFLCVSIVFVHTSTFFRQIAGKLRRKNIGIPINKTLKKYGILHYDRVEIKFILVIF